MLAAILLEGLCWLPDALPYLEMVGRTPSARILWTVWDTPFERRRLQTGAQHIGHVPNTEEACEHVPELPYVRTERTFGFPLRPHVCPVTIWSIGVFRQRIGDERGEIQCLKPSDAYFGTRCAPWRDSRRSMAMPKQR